MNDYGDPMDYYDEELEDSGDSSISPAQAQLFHQQYLHQQQIAQARSLGLQLGIGSSGVIDSSEGMTDSIGISGGIVDLDGFEFMEEELDDNYNPAEEEVEEYARFLGMDVKQDKDLFYIAKEGLKAPLPGSWRPCKSPRGTVFYYNF